MSCTETPGCTGAFDPQGYCDRCGAPAPAATAATPRPTTGSAGRSGAVGTGTPTTSRPSRTFGARLVTLPPIVGPDPVASVLADPEVAEERRFCSAPTCGSPVGRRRGDVPARAEGYCPRCRQPFSFVPQLRGGDVVGGQYEVVGCLAYGGLGWIYLARDRNVDDVWRVLKGVLQGGDPEAIANAIDERRFLASVDHPNIVKIINFVEHDGAGYIVMEHVDGVSLRQLLLERRSTDGQREPLPLTHAISYVLEILPALGHLHEQGLLYCDFKPDNVMCTPSSVKLIDLGGVYRIDDETSPVYGTPGYQAPEIAETGPTVASDLFTVARTLAVLCTRFPDFQTTYRFTLPPPDEVPELARHDALYQVLRRATAPDPDERFHSAEEMADQLRGVLREIVAEETGRPAPGASAFFTGKVVGRVDGPDRHALPVPLMDLDDPAAAYLATVGTYDGDALVTALRAAPERTIEVELQLVRALLSLDQLDEVPPVLADIRRTAPEDWRADWYEGLHCLAVDRPDAARDRFGAVYRHLPGELAPKLAMAMSLELDGDPGGAADWYDRVSRTDPSFTAAAFGSARCCEARGDLVGAAEAYGRVPDTSSRHTDARIAAARLRLGLLADLTDVGEAGRIIDELPLDPARRASLAVAVFEVALPLVAGPPSSPTRRLLGHDLTEAGVRRGLEESYRTLARYAVSPEERIALVDQANGARKWSVV